MRILNAYLRISLMLFIGLLFCVCSPDFNPTRNQSTSSVDLELLIPAKLVQSVADDEGITAGMTAYVALLPVGWTRTRSVAGGLDPRRVLFAALSANLTV